MIIENYEKKTAVNNANPLLVFEYIKLGLDQKFVGYNKQFGIL